MARNKPTDEQQRIIDSLATPLFVEAGAGSGKSATLAERVAWALTPGSGDDGAPYITSLDQVLVITYTHAAADEIREKIRARLRQDPGLAHHALEVDTAWISTIHGMCIRILKAHAFELGLDPELVLIPETRAAELLEQAVDAQVDDVARKPEYRALRAAFDIRGRSAAAGDSGATIMGMAKALQVAAASGVNGFDSLCFAGSVEPLESGLARYLGHCRAMAALADEAGFNHTPSNDGAYAQLQDQIQAIGAFLACPSRTQEDAAALIDALCPFSGKAFSSKALKDSWREFRGAYDGLVFQKALTMAAPLAADLLRLARRIDQAYSAQKRMLGMVDNADLLRMTHDAFERNPQIACIYEGKFRLVMVDEFQDTNEQQVQMISKLSGAGAEHLCTVGDAQQSIYRFQGADVSVFNNRSASVGESCRRSLTANFRSHADILSFVQKTCAGAIIKRFLPLRPRDGYEKFSAYKTPSLPRIAVELISGPTGSDAAKRAAAAMQLAGRIQAYIDAGGSAGDVVLLMGSLVNVQVYLDALRARGIECVVSGGSTFTAAPEVQMVSALLQLLANPYETQRGLYPVLTGELFFCSANDMLLLATADHVPRSDDDARRFDKRQLADGFLAYVREGDAALPADAGPSPCLAAASDVLGRAFGRLGSWQLHDVLEGIVRESGWISRLEAQGPAGIACAANVLAAIRFAAQLADDASLGISRAAQEFSSWLEVGRRGLASLDTGEAGAVRVMTVHASKGLEFPVCAVAELWRDPRSATCGIVHENIGERIFAALLPKDAKMPAIDADAASELAEGPTPASDAPLGDWAAYLSCLHGRSEYAEKGRLLYVALTRAKEALIVCLPVNTAKKDYSWGTSLSPHLASDACMALFGDRLPPLGISYLDYGGTAPAVVRHIGVEKDGDSELGFWCNPTEVLDAAPVQQERMRSVALFDPAVADGVAQARMAAEPRRERTGTFSYSSVHAQLAAAHPQADGAGEDGAPGRVFARAAVIVEEEGDTMPGPAVQDDDKATNLGSAFHQLAQSMVECGRAPSAERVDAAARTWQLTRRQRARLEDALARWERSAIRAEALGYAVRRAEAPFFIEVRSAFGTHLEGAIDLLCTDPARMHALVIDYKTGDSGLTFEQIRAHHAMQANFYAGVLMRLGYAGVECAFVCVELEDGEGQPVVARYRFDEANPPTSI